MTAARLWQRAGQTALALLLLSFLVYMLIGLMPGDPVDLLLAGNPHMTAADAAHLRALYGLNQPLALRYGHWLLAFLHGDAGYSRLYGLPVLAVLWPRLWNTFILMSAALCLTLSLSIPLGVFAARRQGTLADRLVNGFCLAGLALPAFWLALLLIALFAVRFGLLPAGADPAHPLSLILPVVTVAVGGLASYTRHLRASMIEALSADPIRTARAKGCAERRIIWRHAFRAALLPVTTLLMLDLGAMLGGTVTVETVFAYPGMGKLLFDAVMSNDYNLALAGFLLLAAAVMIGNLAADILCARLDPRGETA